MALAVVALGLSCGAASRDWRTIITSRDRTRLHDWRQSWLTGLAQARAGGADAQIAREGALLQPDATIDGPPPPDGDYRCRVIKLGTQGAGPAFAIYPGFHCRIAKGRFTKLDGGQRPAGRLYPYDGMRLLFLGTMVLGDESGGMAYARDPDRDMVGVLEPIPGRRWRLILPAPRWESKLDVIELIPVGG